MIGLVSFKPGARSDHPREAGLLILAAIRIVAWRYKQDLVITSGDEDRGRDLNDPHPLGEAIDVSVAGIAPLVLLKIIDDLEDILGPLFTVLFEAPALASVEPMLRQAIYVNAKATGPHLHIQRKKGTIFPPPAPPAGPRV